MKKEVTRKSFTGLLVCLSIASFVYVNFLANSSSANHSSTGKVLPTAISSSDTDHQDSDSPKSTNPTLAVLSKVYLLINKLVPSGK